MNRPTTKNRAARRIFGTGILLLVLFLAACAGSSNSSATSSALSRPVAMTVALLNWQPTASDMQAAETYKDSWSACLGKTKRPFAFVANSVNNSVARIDLCTQEIMSTHLFGNPFVITHIPVGEFPIAVAASREDGQSRIFVANSGENTLSIIDSTIGRALENKVGLPSRPARLVVVPSVKAIPEGDVIVALPEVGQLARIVKQDATGFETWAMESAIVLKNATTPAPKPAAMVLSPGGRYLYVADASSTYFHVVDLEHQDYPPRLCDVSGPQRDLALSPDGRFLYLAKLNERKVAVYDLVDDRYVDTNNSLPSHWNAPPPSAEIDYDLALQAVPRLVRFASVDKSITDGDSDSDSEESESEGTETGEDESETARKAAEDESEADGDLDTDVEAEQDAESYDMELYAYVIGTNGNVQVVDVQKDKHAFYDTTPSTAASSSLLTDTELYNDSSRCLAHLKTQVAKTRTPTALWQLFYNTVLAETDAGLSGRFDFANNRFYDEGFNFATLKSLRTRAQDAGDPASRWTIKGDWLEITTAPLSPGQSGVGCLKDGVGLRTVRLEIVDATPDYLVFDPDGLNLKNCYDPTQIARVSYVVRSHDNYIVYMTPVDAGGAASGPRVYKGRAVNAPFYPDFSHPDDSTFKELILNNPDWSDYVCTLPHTAADGSVTNEYRFTQDLTLASSDDVLRGIRCLTPWEDPPADASAPVYKPSFEDDTIAFSVCLDDTYETMAKKLQGSYVYSFTTANGIGSVTETNSDGSVTSFIGSLPEDAAVLETDPLYPRLYLLDSSQELIYVIDLLSDTLISTIY